MSRAEKPGPGERFDWPLMLGEFAIVLWLWYACGVFTNSALAWWPDAPGLGLAAALCSRRLGLHARPSAQSWSRLVLRSAALAPLLAGLAWAAAALRGAPIGPALALWLGSAAALLGLGFRVAFWAARSKWPDRPGEILRWLAMGGAGFVLLFSYYGRQSVGAGDAYWYVVMVADFIAQIHHGIFPVWVGQSEYAFNGAVSPLRLAPWFQYSAGFWDLVTCHALEPTALKNAVVAASGLATAASAYLAVRLALPRRPNLAGVLALLWLASPAVLAPLYAGDQYMEWSSLPFLPPLLLGCWRLWTRDDAIARLLITAALAGLMLSHTPTALWGGLLAAGMYLGQLLRRRAWAAEGRHIAWMTALFLLLGGFPVGSALTIDNAAGMTIQGSQIPPEIAKVFPGNFEPISRVNLGLQSYQLGYVLLAAGVLALALLAWLRPRGATAFAVALLAFVPLTLPVPGLTSLIWTHLPRVITTITNVWPTQRLFDFWSLLIVFALVLAADHPRLDRRAGWMGLLLLALAGGSLWSAREAAKMVVGIRGTFVDPATTNIYLRPENLQLTRYVYASFASAPGYASHGHLDPVLENRLLDGRTLRVIAANADAAAPAVDPDSPPGAAPRVAQSGLWVAVNDNHSRFYNLVPQIRLEPGQHYALRLDFLQPDREGYLQVFNNDIFREYILPDSGLGLSSSPLAFGALPTSSHVVELQQRSPASTEPMARFVAPKYSGEQFDFARFWLYTYDLANLPVRVSSWIPYRAETETALPAFLETPRAWQRGWRARVNGRPVATRESPEHLVMIPLAPGTSQVVLTFRAPLWLSGWFWVCLAGWVTLLGCGGWRVVRRAGLTASPAQPLPWSR